MEPVAGVTAAERGGRVGQRGRYGIDGGFAGLAVVSSLALSNIRDAGGRAQALREAVRVLRPGGRLYIVDDGADRYAAVLRDAGCTGVAVRQLDWRTWYGIPGHHLTLVAAARPPG